MLVDAAHTLRWAGLGPVTFGGDPLPFTVASASGLDYTQPVPEPATWALWLAGLAGMARVASRRFSGRRR